MFSPQSLEPLTKEFVLSRIREEDIFLKYMNIYPDLTQRYRNPLRDDGRPGCAFYRDPRGVLKFKDPAIKLNIDCFNLIQVVNPECNTFDLILKRIVKDFNLQSKDIDYSVIADWKEAIDKASKKFSLIQVKRKDFTKEELQWWQEQGIYLPTLNLYRVSSLQLLWLNGDIIYSYSRKDIGFVYHFGEYKYKAYFPNRDMYRFLQNIGTSLLQGYDQLPEGGDYLVITKSMKDVMCLNSFDIPSIAPSSETVLVQEEQFGELENRFAKIYTLYDKDRAGLHASWEMRKMYKTIPLFFESEGIFRKTNEPKDFTDHFKKYGTSYMSDLIEETIEKYG